MRPAEERLDGDDGARGEIDLRLVVELEFFILDRASKVVDESQSVDLGYRSPGRRRRTARRCPSRGTSPGLRSA